ncbi:MAG: GIY-YIG nuclease family protein [Armatimonadetes bacterium]|nr:GIY-YIG nuclease family protein [Armatimonadota bacterium]
MGQYFVYIIQSLSNHHFYIGQTYDVIARLQRHNAGGCTATRNKGPWVLRATRQFHSRAEAIAEERRLKAMKSSQYLQHFIQQFPPFSDTPEYPPPQLS